MYAKLIDGALQTAPKHITVDNVNIWNASTETMLSQGWKLVVFTDAPKAPEGYYYESGWEEKDNTIVQTWTLVEITDIDDTEALNIILGGTE